jgi:molecular chaperone DnaJ
MRVKDYYKTLDLKPDASIEDIKKSYRKLAMQYHPDKNQGDKIAEAHFTEIKEAYETLVDPNKRDVYHQQRWYNNAMGKRFADTVPLTPDSVLKEVINLDKYVSTLNVFRIDYAGLISYMNNLLSDEVITKLKDFNEREINRKIIKILLNTCDALLYEYVVKFSERLKKAADEDDAMHIAIDQYLKKRKRQSQWEKYKIAVIFAFVLLICWLIYSSGQS